jgi:hypothetical protein
VQVPDPSPANSLLSGFLGGVVVADLNYVVTRRKTLAVILKLARETAKIRKKPGNVVASILAAVGYIVTGIGEQHICAS